MKVSYSEYIKKSDVSVLISEAIFTELEKQFPLLKISEVANTTSGGTPLRNIPEYYDGDIAWLKSGELNDGLIENAEEFITVKGLENSSAKLLPKGTLLVAMYGATAGKTGITGLNASTNQAICAVFPNNKVERDYLYWFFRSHRYKFIEKSKGGAQPNISQSVILNTKIPIPPKVKQENIATILNKIQNENKFDLSYIPEEFKQIVSKVFYSKNSVTEIEGSLNHQFDVVKQLRQAFLREAMQGKLTTKWREENPDVEPTSELLKKIKAEKEKLVKEGKLKKQKPLPAIKEDEIPFIIPESWEWCRLGELCNYGSSPKADPKDINDETWVLDLEDIEKETSKLLQKITFKERKSSSTKSIFNTGDVLYSKLRPYLDKVIVAEENGVCTTEILPLRFYGSINPFFMRFNLKRKDFLQYVNGVTKGMKMPRLGTKEGTEAIMPIPPLSEQQQIVTKLDELMQYCNKLEESIKTCQQQNEMLLQQVLREALEPIEKTN